MSIKKFLETDVTGHEMMVAIQEVIRILRESDTGSGEFCVTEESGDFGVCYSERGIDLVRFHDEIGDMEPVFSLKVV